MRQLSELLWPNGADTQTVPNMSGFDFHKVWLMPCARLWLCSAVVSPSRFSGLRPNAQIEVRLVCSVMLSIMGCWFKRLRRRSRGGFRCGAAPTLVFSNRSARSHGQRDPKTVVAEEFRAPNALCSTKKHLRRVASSRGPGMTPWIDPTTCEPSVCFKADSKEGRQARPSKRFCSAPSCSAKDFALEACSAESSFDLQGGKRSDPTTYAKPDMFAMHRQSLIGGPAQMRS